MTSLDSINGSSIQTLLSGENDSKQSDEIQAGIPVEQNNPDYLKALWIIVHFQNLLQNTTIDLSG